jgi:hypothetical protein
MDDIREDNVRCVRDFYVMSELLRRNFRICDINKDKKFICPILNEKCTYKSVVYFEVVDGLDDAIKEIYEMLEDSKRG